METMWCSSFKNLQWCLNACDFFLLAQALFGPWWKRSSQKNRTMMTAAQRRRPPSRPTPPTVTLGQCVLLYTLAYMSPAVFIDSPPSDSFCIFPPWWSPRFQMLRTISFMLHVSISSHLNPLQTPCVNIIVHTEEHTSAMQCSVTIFSVCQSVCVWPLILPCPPPNPSDSAWTVRVTAVTARAARVETLPHPHRNTTPPITKWVIQTSFQRLLFNSIKRAWNRFKLFWRLSSYPTQIRQNRFSKQTQISVFFRLLQASDYKSVVLTVLSVPDNLMVSRYSFSPLSLFLILSVSCRFQAERVQIPHFAQRRCWRRDTTR